MATKDGTRVKETTTTTGSGALSLSGAPSGFNTFVSEIGSGNQVNYWLFDASGTSWECGVGTVTSGLPNTLARTTIIRSSNANAAINLSRAGAHTIVNAPMPGYATGDVNHQGNKVINANLQSYTEVVADPVISGGVLTLDLSISNVFDVAHNANITSMAFINADPNADSMTFTLTLTQDSVGGRTVAFPASVVFPSGINPALTSIPGNDNVLTFFTVNSGATWRGALVGKDYA